MIPTLIEIALLLLGAITAATGFHPIGHIGSAIGIALAAMVGQSLLVGILLVLQFLHMTAVTSNVLTVSPYYYRSALRPLTLALGALGSVVLLVRTVVWIVRSLS